MPKPCRSIMLANKRAEQMLVIGEMNLRLGESLIRLADTLAERIELEPPDVSRLAIDEAMLVVSQSMKLMALYKRVI